MSIPTVVILLREDLAHSGRIEINQLLKRFSTTLYVVESAIGELISEGVADISDGFLVRTRYQWPPMLSGLTN